MQVFEAVAAQSVQVQEVASYLDIFHKHRIPGTIYNTVLFQTAQDTLKDDNKSRAWTIDCAAHWAKIKKNLPTSSAK